MKGFFICLMAAMAAIILSGCSDGRKTGDLIKEDSLKNQEKVNSATYKEDRSVTFASPTPSPTPVPTYEPVEGYDKPIGTEQEYRDYAEYIILRQTKFHLVNTRMQPFEGTDSYGIEHDSLATVSILCELPSEKDALLDNKYGIEYKDIVKEVDFETQFSHGISWVEPAICNEVFQKFDEGLTGYALLRSSILGSPTRQKLIVYVKLNGKQYLHGVEDNQFSLTMFGDYGVKMTTGREYYLNGGLVNLQYSPLGTSMLATFGFANFSSEYEPDEEALNKLKIRGSFRNDPEHKQYEASLSYDINGVRPSKLGTFFATFDIPLQGETSAIKDKIDRSFEITIYNEREEEIVTFEKADIESE